MTASTLMPSNGSDATILAPWMGQAVTAGSLCTGYGGLDTAVEKITGAKLLWCAEKDPDPSKILKHRFKAPNLGDITEINWAELEPVEVLTASWPCFVAGTIIHTARGDLPIEEVVVGDMVLTHERRYRAVTTVMVRENAPLIEVRTFGAPPITTTSEHPFLARRRYRYGHYNTRMFTEPEWLDAKDLTISHFTAQVVGVDGDSPEPPSWYRPELAYFLGRWLGDGWVDNSSTHKRYEAGKVKVCCAHEEQPELDGLLRAAGFKPSWVKQRTSYRATICNLELARGLTEHFGKGAHLKHLPGWVYGLPEAEKRELVAGWVDSDGHWADDGGWYGATTSRALAVGLARLCRETTSHAGMISAKKVKPTKVIEGRTVNQRPWYRVQFQPPKRTPVAFADKEYVWGQVRKVSPAGIGTVYNISVDEDESYTADGVVVHNCQPVSSAGKRLGNEDPRFIWPHVTKALEAIRPRLFFGENVRGHLSKDWDRIVNDLVDLGYAVRWGVVAAAHVGAPHLRMRVWVVATLDDTPNPEGTPTHHRVNDEWIDSKGRVTKKFPAWAQVSNDQMWTLERPDLRELFGASFAPFGDTKLPTPTAGGHNNDEDVTSFLERRERLKAKGTNGNGAGMPLGVAVRLLPTTTTTDAKSSRNSTANRSVDSNHDGLTLTDALVPTPTARDAKGAKRSDDLASVANQRMKVDWGPYAPAIGRWANILGRPAPKPTVRSKHDKDTLNPKFMEWMQGIPSGWVTSPKIGLTATAQKRILGNGVVPQCAIAAYQLLGVKPVRWLPVHPIKHPARYSDEILKVMRTIIEAEALLIGSKPKALDPMCGTLEKLEESDLIEMCDWTGIEIEPLWAACSPRIICGNALDLPFEDESFDIAANSPTYGNRFRDCFNARDASERRSYTFDMRANANDPGYLLHEDNSGTLRFGTEAYELFHKRTWAEVYRTLRPGGLFILNASDFIEGGELREVVKLHRDICLGLGFELAEEISVGTKRYRKGANRELRAPSESVMSFRKPR